MSSGELTFTVASFGGLERLVAEEAAGVERVVVAEHVDEPLALDDHALTRVAEAAADADREQNADERGVEDEVARLAKVAALGAHGVRVLLDPVALRPQYLAGGLDDGRRVSIRRRRGEAGQSLEARGGLRRACLEGEVVVARARDHAADEGDEEEKVDGREPR
jgi:hypothetical protein